MRRYFDWHTIQRSIREQRFGVFASFLVVLVFAIALWSVWQAYSDPLQFPARNLWIADGLIALNLLLAAWTLTRERFASLLLLGATLVFEILVMIFLYQI
ncbi:hypothetical protein HY523_02900 [Candidatus Berkelbacteria bacterium]|nr:hypothetical protein [Candidatus Berkelbacteria bacterium]